MMKSVGETGELTLVGLLAVEDAWTREARIVLDLAARLGVTLDEEALLLSDVRDLQALGQRLREGHPRRAA